METNNIELYGTITKFVRLDEDTILLYVTEKDTDTEWKVLAMAEKVDCEPEEGLHVYIKGETGVQRHGIFADYVDRWGRICSHCGKHHEEGYYSENTGEYACSDECLHKLFTEEEREEEREREWLFWTEWYN